MKPRLLVLTSTYPRWPNDSEPGFVHELSRRLCDDFQVTVLAPHSPGAKAAETMDGVNIKRFRYAPQALEQLAYEGGIAEKLRHKPWRILLVPLLLTAQLLATRRAISRYQPAVIHAHWIFPQAFIAALANSLSRNPVPILCTVHGSDWHSLQGRFWSAIKRWTLKRCDVIAPVSGILRQDIQQTGWITGELAEPMPMGIHIPDQVPPLSKREPNTLLFAGRLVPGKGVDVLLEAMSILRTTHPELRLQIAGGGENTSHYKQRTRELELGKQVEFLGRISHEDVYTRMARSQICVIPSEHEGLGLVLLEALSCGCIVVASDIPVFREILRSVGDHGYSFTTGNPQALAEAIDRAAQNARQQAFVDSPGQNPVAAYSWQVSSGRYSEKLNRILHGE